MAVDSSEIVSGASSATRRRMIAKFVEDTGKTHWREAMLPAGEDGPAMLIVWTAQLEARLIRRADTDLRWQKGEGGFRRLWTKLISMTLSQRQNFMPGLSEGEDTEMMARIISDSV